MVFGVSRDKPEAQAAFKQKHNLSYSLLSDPEGKLAGTFGFKPGERKTVVISKDGKVEKIYDKVAPKDHAAQVAGELGK